MGFWGRTTPIEINTSNCGEIPNSAKCFYAHFQKIDDIVFDQQTLQLKIS